MRFRFLIFIALVLLASAVPSLSQRRDYLTEAEVEIVRNNQEIDTRISALSRMIDRRFIVIGIDTAAGKPKKSEDDWGPEPKGTKLEILSDIRQLLEKAIDDIDSIPGRLPEKMKDQKKGVNLFNNAVRSLASSAGRWKPYLIKEHSAAETAGDEKLYGLTAGAIELCEQIIEASAKVK